jgi:hypothetical protein
MSRDGSRATVRHVFIVAVDCRLLMLLRRWLHLRSSPTPSHTATHRRSTVAPAPPSPPPPRPPLITGDGRCRTLTTPSALTRHRRHRPPPPPSDAAVPPIRHAPSPPPPARPTARTCRVRPARRGLHDRAPTQPVAIYSLRSFPHTSIILHE